MDDFDCSIQCDEYVPEAYENRPTVYASIRSLVDVQPLGMLQEPASRPEPVQSIADASYDDRYLDMLNAWEVEREIANGYR